MSSVWKRPFGKRILLVALLTLLVFSLSGCNFSLESALEQLKAYVNGTEVAQPPAGFVESRENDEYAYDVYDKYVIITAYLGEEVDVIVPAKIGRLPVRSIAGLAFYEGVPVESVVVSEGIEALEENAFYYCTELKSVTLPESLTSIGDKAFSWCSSLETIILPEAVTAIPPYCFNQCTSLTKVYYSHDLVAVGARAFSGCESLEKLYFGDAMVSIGDYAFRGCSKLATLRLGAECVFSENAMTEHPDILTVFTPMESPCWTACHELGIMLMHDDGTVILPEEPEESSGEESGDVIGGVFEEESTEEET